MGTRSGGLGLGCIDIFVFFFFFPFFLSLRAAVGIPPLVA